MCCLQEVRHGIMMLGVVGRRYNFWWSGKGDGGVGVMVIVLGVGKKSE